MIKDTRVVKDAVYLIDDKTMTSRGYAQSGWDYDNRGMRKARGEEIRGIYLCSDETGDFDPYLSRRFVPVKTGKAGFFPQLPPALRRRFLFTLFERRQKRSRRA